MATTIPTLKPQPYAGLPPFAVRRFTVAEYHQMLEAGVLTEDDRVELLRGWIVPKMGHNPPHSVSMTLVETALRSRLPVGWFLRVQLPVTAIGESEPEPDIAIVRGKPRDFIPHHPGVRDAGILIEIADTSLDDDREYKGALYAEAGYPIYWIVNLISCQVEVYSAPTGSSAKPSYRDQHDYLDHQEVPLLLDGQEVARIPVRDLLP